MARLGMVIDLKRCIGCNACTIACKAEQATPPGTFWARVLEKETGKYPTARRVFLPVMCNHCKEPPCQRACPSGATAKRGDGVVVVDYNKCTGCRACMTACPYNSRSYLKKIKYYYPQGPIPFEEQGYQRFQEGVVVKCTFCSERLERGLQPACAQACPTSARSFGDLDDPTSNVSRLVRQRYAFQLRPETGADPSVFYLPY